MKEIRKNECSWELNQIPKLCSNCGGKATYILGVGFFRHKTRNLCNVCAVKWMKGEITV